jgi:Tetratricopeptide repeat
MDPTSAPIVKRFLQVWTPTLMLLDPDGNVYTEWNGYLPPALYLAQLLLGLGKAALKQDRFEQAVGHFNEVAANHPGTDTAAEALYWAAVSRYKGSHDGVDLFGGWEKLRGSYPESVWRTKQSFSEM